MRRFKPRDVVSILKLIDVSYLGDRDSNRPDALVDQATAANTIARELSHARDYLRGGAHKPHGWDGSLDDRSVYGSGNNLEDWIKGNR